MSPDKFCLCENMQKRQVGGLPFVCLGQPISQSWEGLCWKRIEVKSGKYEPAACCIDLELNPKINATRPILISVSRLSAHGSAIKRGGTAVISSLTLHTMSAYNGFWKWTSYSWTFAQNNSKLTYQLLKQQVRIENTLRFAFLRECEKSGIGIALINYANSQGILRLRKHPMAETLRCFAFAFEGGKTNLVANEEISKCSLPGRKFKYPQKIYWGKEYCQRKGGLCSAENPMSLRLAGLKIFVLHKDVRGRAAVRLPNQI